MLGNSSAKLHDGIRSRTPRIVKRTACLMGAVGTYQSIAVSYIPVAWPASNT